MTKLDQIIEFVSRELRSEYEWPISAEYPQVFQPNNLHNLKFLEKNGAILSHAALKPLIVKTPHFIFKIATIGSVVTDKNHRHQGLSSQMITSCLKEAEQQDCDLAILWTHLHDWYRKFGFELAGYEEHFAIQSPLAIEPLSLRYQEGNKVDPQAILRLFQQHTITSYRTTKDIELFLRIPNSRVFTAWDENHSLRAYSVMGKGADLQGYIHEWGGDIVALINLWNHIVEQTPFIALVGPQSTNLITFLQRQKLQGYEGYLGMMRIVRRDLLTQKIKNYVRYLGGKNFALHFDDGGPVRVELNHTHFTLPSERHLIRLLFGPHDTNLFPRDFASSIESFFPIPLWIWGWDSI